MSNHLGRVPIYEVWFQATESGAAATVFMAMMLTALFVTSIGSAQSGSRLTWSFARDDAMILSKYVKRTSARYGVPIWSLIFNGVWLSIVGCVHLISSSGEPHLHFVLVIAEADSLMLNSIQYLHWLSHACRAHLLQFPGRFADVAAPRPKISANQ